MDKYEVRLMNQAMRDLDDIYAYIAGNLLEPGVAAEMVDALESEILSLEYLPYRCSERRTGSFANSGYRQLMVKNYIVIYDYIICCVIIPFHALTYGRDFIIYNYNGSA